MKKICFMAFLCLILLSNIWALKSLSENVLLWKVSGKQLQRPSYLFGTYHFLTNAFVDSLSGVKAAYNSCTAVAGELVIDTSIQRPMMEAAILKGTTLKKLLPDTLYQKVVYWFKEEAGIDLAKLDNFNPMTILTVAMAVGQQKYFPNKPGEIQLDTYFQEQGKKDNKQILGLETIDVQVNALFKKITIQRQIDLLNDMFKNNVDIKKYLGDMNKAYASQDLAFLKNMMYNGSYKPYELKALLDDRNSHWVDQLPGLMLQQPIFVAVGALHLVGKNGLVQQLRALGYMVTSVNLKDQ